MWPRILLLSVVLSLATFTGCIEDQLEQTDQVAYAVEDSAQSAQDVLSGPAGVFVPEPYRTAAVWGLSGLAAVAAWWNHRRKNQFKKVGQELSYAIEIFERDSNFGNKELQQAKDAALNPSTVEIVNKFRKAG